MRARRSPLPAPTLTAVIVGSRIGSGIAVRKADNDLQQKFNAAIVAVRANGVYKKIQDKYFDFDVYGK